jgi:hypothetical protein
MSPFSHMPLILRLEKYRDLATDARREALLKEREDRAQFLFFATQWDKLASPLEEQLHDGEP